MKKIILLLLAAVFSLTAVSAQNDYTDLIISEYAEGSSNNKALELYNGTNASIELSGYSLKKQTNGVGEYVNELVLEGTLAAGEAYVIVNSQAGEELKALADLLDTKVTAFNGNDAVGLFKAGTQIDEVGVFDQTTDWGKDLGLIRNCDVKSPKVPYDAARWTVLEKDDWSNLGSHCGADITGPEIRKYNILSTTTMSLEFNEQLDKPSAALITNYVITPGITVSAAVQSPEGNMVTLTFSALTEGTEYTLTVNNIKDMSENVMTEKVITFIYGSTADNICANLGELRAKYVEGVDDNFTVTGTVVVTVVSSLSSRYQFWIQDETAGMLVDDPGFLFTTKFKVGDNIKNLQGKLDIFNGTIQLRPSLDVPKEAEATKVITPPTITLADILNAEKMEEFQSMLVKVENVTFPDAGKFENDKNYRLSGGGTTDSLLRTHFWFVDYIGTDLPSKTLSITGIIILSYDKNYISPRTAADMGEESPTEPDCANIGELRGRKVGSIEYNLNNTVVITAIGTMRGQKYIQDETGAILIDDSDSIVSMDLQVGDNISGLKGKLSEFNGLLQFRPSVNAVKEAKTKTIEPFEVTLQQLGDVAFMARQQSKLIRVRLVAFPEAGATFINGKKYLLSAGFDTDTLLRCPFFNVDYINTVIPTGVKDITGIADLNWNKYYIAPRFMADIITGSVSNENFLSAGIKMYPNPTSGVVYLNLDAEYDLSVYNFYGAKIMEKLNASDLVSLDLGNFAKGLYFVVLRGANNKVITSKLVVR